MTPGSTQSTIAEAVRFARHRNDTILAEDLEAAGRKIAAAIRAGDALIDSATPHPSDAAAYCVSVACFDELSVALTSLGGA